VSLYPAQIYKLAATGSASRTFLDNGPYSKLLKRCLYLHTLLMKNILSK